MCLQRRAQTLSCRLPPQPPTPPALALDDFPRRRRFQAPVPEHVSRTSDRMHKAGPTMRQRARHYPGTCIRYVRAYAHAVHVKLTTCLHRRPRTASRRLPSPTTTISSPTALPQPASLHPKSISCRSWGLTIEDDVESTTVACEAPCPTTESTLHHTRCSAPREARRGWLLACKFPFVNLNRRLPRPSSASPSNLNRVRVLGRLQRSAGASSRRRRRRVLQPPRPPTPLRRNIAAPRHASRRSDGLRKGRLTRRGMALPLRRTMAIKCGVGCGGDAESVVRRSKYADSRAVTSRLTALGSLRPRPSPLSSTPADPSQEHCS
jgi:hypothetical protein